MRRGPLYVSLTSSLYESTQVAYARRSAPASLIFWMPVNKAYSHPLRRAECSSLRLVTLTCTSTDATDTAALARITPSAGKAKPGAYAAICATYARENTEVKPVVRTMFCSMLASVSILERRADRSPDAYAR